MKKCVLSILLAACPLFSFSQQRATVANAKMNILYLNIPNPMLVTAEGYSRSSTYITTNNGTIERDTTQYADYVLTPQRLGSAKIYIWVDDSGTKRKIDSMEFSVKLLPDPRAFVAGNTYSFVGAKKKWTGLTAGYENFDFDVRFEVAKFTVTILRDSSVVFQGKNIGQNFQPEIREKIVSAQEGDLIKFTKIEAVGPAGRIYHPGDIEISVK